MGWKRSTDSFGKSSLSDSDVNGRPITRGSVGEISGERLDEFERARRIRCCGDGSLLEVPHNVESDCSITKSRLGSKEEGLGSRGDWSSDTRERKPRMAR